MSVIKLHFIVSGNPTNLLGQLLAATNPAFALAASTNPAFATMAAAAAYSAAAANSQSLLSATPTPESPASSSSINGVLSQDKSPFLPNGNMPFGKPPPTQLLAPELRVEDKTYELKDGWGKRVTQRTSGSSMGKFDVYLTNPISTKRLRSIPELLKFIKDNPHCPIGKYPFMFN